MSEKKETKTPKIRPIETILSSLLLFIGGIFSAWMIIPNVIPIFRFAAILPIITTVILFLTGVLLLVLENTEIGTFIALGLGLAFTLFYLSSMSIGLQFIFQGILPLLAGILGFRSQKETRRKVWIARIKGFWFEFSHNKIGLVGLSILLVFLFIAIFQDPIAALSYPNPDTQSLAENYAKPSWIGLIEPASRGLPPTINHTLQWNWNLSMLPENVTITTRNDTWVIQYNRTDMQKITLIADATFEYPYNPPFKYYFRFTWGAYSKSARYSIEINWTTPNGKTWPLWDQHWWRYKGASCFLPNPNPPPVVYPYPEWWGPNRLYYPGSTDYQHFFEHQQYQWTPKKYDRMGYDIYDTYYGGNVPTWTENVGLETVVYASDNRYPPIRMGFKEWETKEMTTALFNGTGTYKLHLYITLFSTQSNGSCEIGISNFRIDIPGLVWGLLGTDYTGHDCWSRLIYGARTSLAVGLAAAIISTSIGMLVGIVAGYTGGIVDEILMRTVDVLLCIPLLPLLMVMVTLFGRSIIYIIIIIAVFGWQGLSRLVRSQVLSIREAPFIDCAKASGGSSSYIMIKHLLPNVLPVALADFILSVPGAILLEAALSFIGFGDPNTPTWGREYSLMQDVGGVFIPGQGIVWWWFIPPGIAITLLCVAFVFLGHAVDEIVNPRLRRRR